MVLVTGIKLIHWIIGGFMEELLAMSVNKAVLLVSTGENKLARTASWLKVNLAGDEVNGYETGPCHSDLGEWGEGHDYVINFFQVNYEESHGPGKWSHSTHEDRVAFMDWLANRSPYKEGFYDRCAETMLERGFAILNGSAPGNVLGGAAVAQRRLWEHTQTFTAWCDLVKAGVGENEAFLLGHCLQGSTNRKGMFSWGNTGTGHTTINPCELGGKAWKNFCGDKWASNEKSYLSTGTYTGYSAMFGQSRGSPLLTTIRELLADKVKGAKDNNPFRKPGVANYSKKYGGAISDLVGIYPDLLKEMTK
jgi:hypothetical protein